MSRRLKLPKMRFHRTNRLVYVRLDGKMVYLGVAKVGDVPSKVRDRYDEVIQRWLAGKSVDNFSLTIDELAMRYVEHACRRCRKCVHETFKVSSIRFALRVLGKVAGTTDA